MADTPLAPVVRHLHKLAGLSPMPNVSDAQLLERFVQHRDEDAFAALVRRHGPLVWRVCRRVLHQTQHAEEAYQAVFLVLARQAAKVRKPTALASWLYAVAYRIARKARADLLRQSRQREPITAPVADPADEAAWRELEQIVVEEVHELPEKYRAPILLCYWEGLTNEEAAARLGWPAGTVKTRLLKARQRLHERLTRRGVSLSAGTVVTLLAASSGEAATPPIMTAAAARLALDGTAGASAAVAALADQAVQGAMLSKVKIILVLLLGSAITAGVGAFAYHKPLARQPEEQPKAKSREAEQPKAQAEQLKIRTDRYGDPLPPGAIARMGTLRLRHAGGVRQVVFSPDGKTLASASDDATVRLWDAATGKELHRLMGNEGSVSSVAFSPDGKLLASGTHGPHGRPNYPVFLWDATTGKQLRRLQGHKNEVQVVAFSPDGKTLASAGYGKSIRLWDVASDKERCRLEAAEKNIFALAFSPDGRLLASGGGDQVVRLWDIAKGTETRQFRGHRDSILAIVFFPDGKTLATAERAGIVRLWNVRTGESLRQIRAGQHHLGSLAFVPGRKALVTGGFTEPICLWDTATGEKLPPFNEDHRGSCTLRANGKQLAAWNGSAIQLWDLTTAKEMLHLEGHRSSVRAAAFLGDGKTLISSEASAEPGYRICTWDTATGRQNRRITGSAEKGRHMTFSPDAAILAAAGEHAGDNAVRLWDVRAGKKLHTLVHRVNNTQVEGVTALAYAPDGRMLATASGNAFGDEKASYFLYLWDAVTGQQVRCLPAHKSVINALDFSPDGRRIASASWDRTLCMWNTATGKEIRCLKGHEDGVRTVVFSPDGRLLASAGQDGTVRIWEAATGSQVRRVKAWATRLVFSPDGKTLASVNGLLWNNIVPDNVLRLWDVMTGEPVGKFASHPDGVTLMLFASDGKTLVSGGDDSTLLTWDVSACRKDRSMQRADLTSGELETCWGKLADRDAAVAYRAIGRLLTAPGQAVSLVRERVRPESPETPPHIAALISRLDDERFRVREETMAELSKLGDQAESALRKALASKPSLEVRHRAEQLLEKLEGAAIPPDQLRELRALVVLEHLGTSEARELLKTLADGAPEARLTREAKASLQRLTRLENPTPRR